MTEPIVNPQIPYVGDVPGGLQPGKMIRIQGVTHHNSDRFNINLATGPSSKPRDDTALHLSVRLNQGYVARNSYKDGSWGDEQGSGKLPIGNAQSFEIIILLDPNHYKIAMNGQHFCEFSHRIPYQQVTHLLIDGDVAITLISFEGIVIPGNITASQATHVNAEGPQAPPPQFGGPQYGPPPGGYGPPPPNFGGYGPPPPPGAHPESQFGGFLDQAQELLVGAIKSAATEKLLSSVLNSGGGQQQPQGYAHQNAKYGIYPDLPSQDTTRVPQNTGNSNEHDSSLSNLIAGSGGTIMSGPQPQSVENTSSSGADYMSSILSNIFKTYKQDNPQNPQEGGQSQNLETGNASKNPHGLDLLTNLLQSVINTRQNPAASGATSNQQGDQSQHGSDVLSGILSNIIPNQNHQNSGSSDQSQNIPQGQPQFPQPQLPPQVQPQVNPQGQSQLPPQNQTQGSGSDLLTGLLQGLLSTGGNQQPTPTVQSANNQGPTQQGQPQFSQPQLPPQVQPQVNPQGQSQLPPQNQTQGSGSELLTGLLQGLLSTGGNQQPTPTVQSANNQGPTQQGQPQFSQPQLPPQVQPQVNPQGQNQLPAQNQTQGSGSDLLTGLLQGLLSTGGNQQPTPTVQNINNQGPTQQPENQNQNPQSHQDNAALITNLLQGLLRKANEQQNNTRPIQETHPSGGAPQNAGPPQGPQQQYGQYPHPPQEEQRGPVESLLSGLLSGGGQQQQPHQQVGGEGSIGGLGNVGGLLGSLAGSFLHRPDPNQRH